MVSLSVSLGTRMWFSRSITSAVSCACNVAGRGSFQLERQIAYLPGVAEGAGHASLFSGAISYLA